MGWVSSAGRRKVGVIASTLMICFVGKNMEVCRELLEKIRKSLWVNP